MKSLFSFLFLAVILSAQSQLQFINGSFNGLSAQRIIPQANGDRIIIGSQTVPGPVNASGAATTRAALLFYAISPAGTQDSNFGFASPTAIGGNGNDIVSDAAVDPNGDIWIVGSTDSDDFPLVNPLFSQKVAYRTTGFVLELDPTGRKILFSSYLGGHSAANRQTFSKATNLAVGPKGDIYILGNTSEADFPVTPGVFGTAASLINGFQGEVYSWVVQISGAGTLQYSTFLGGSQSNCQGGNGCVGILARTIGDSIAVDASGAVTVAGVTSAMDFPATPGVYQPQCQCIAANFAGFVSRIAPGGSRLIWSTYFGSLYLGGAPNLLIAVDATGAVFTFGRPQPAAANSNPLDAPPDLVAAELRPDGTGLVYMTDLGQSNDASLAGITIDMNGNVLMAGTDSSLTFTAPTVGPALGSDFVLALDSTGANPRILYRLVSGTVTQPPAIDASGNLLLLSSQGSLLALASKITPSQSTILAVGNSATYTMAPGIGAGELVSLYGVCLGPSAALTATLDAAGRLPSKLGGVQVIVAGVAAPLLYAGPNQINLQIPFETSGVNSFPAIEVDGACGKSTVQVNTHRSLGLFYAGAPPNGAAANQDGSVNSAQNPAQAGTVVSIFGTGAALEPALDGDIATTATTLSQRANEFEVFDNFGNELTIQYAGSSPGSSNGVFQINVQLPAGEVDPVLTLHAAGGLVSNSIAIHAR